MEELRGKSDAVELQRRLHGMKGVIVVEKDLRDRFGIVRGLEDREVERREGANLESEGKEASLKHHP